MDDFFKNKPDENGRIAVYTPSELRSMKQQLMIDDRKLDLWVTLYGHNLGLPNIDKYLEQCDAITYWTWRAEALNGLEQSFDQFEQISPSSRKVLGCYMLSLIHI